MLSEYMLECHRKPKLRSEIASINGSSILGRGSLHWVSEQLQRFCRRSASVADVLLPRIVGHLSRQIGYPMCP